MGGMLQPLVMHKVRADINRPNLNVTDTKYIRGPGDSSHDSTETLNSFIRRKALQCILKDSGTSK